MQTAGPVGSRPPAPLTTGRVRLAPRTCVLFTMKFMFTPMLTPCLLNPRSACSGAGSAPWWRPGPPYCRHRCQRYSMPCAVCRALSTLCAECARLTRAVTCNYQSCYKYLPLPEAYVGTEEAAGCTGCGPERSRPQNQRAWLS